MADYDGATCHCGGAWFKLEATRPEEAVGAVCLDAKGHVSGYSGHPVCADCGDEWKPPRERLRVVGD